MTSSAPNLETYITIFDPCYKPASLSDLGQTNPPEYFYTEGGSEFKMRAFVLDPPVCPITYECVSATATVNSTSVKCNDPGTVDFDSKTGNLIFTTFDKEKYVPGIYMFTLRVTAGTEYPVYNSVTITFTLTNPCPTAKPLVMNQFPFIDMRYTLGRDAIK